MAYLRWFCAVESGNAAQLKANEGKRLALYQLTAAFLRAYADLANELAEAGYGAVQVDALKAEADHYAKARDEVKLASGDAIDLKMYEPAMRHLIDTYIRAEESEKISAFDDRSLIQLIVERGADAVKELPKGIRDSNEAVAETIENNVRKLIIDETPINPKYYERMSQLLYALIEQRRKGVIEYQDYLTTIADLTRQATNPGGGSTYPAALDTSARRALYDNLGRDEGQALAVDRAVRDSRQDGWRSNPLKVKKLRLAIKAALERPDSPEGHQRTKESPVPYEAGAVEDIDALTNCMVELVKNQHEY